MNHRIAIAVLILCTIASLACDDSSSQGGGNDTFAMQDGTPGDQLLADLKSHAENHLRVTYKASFSSPDKSQDVTVVWQRDGVDRQRFDFVGVKEFLATEAASVFTFGYKDRLVVCSDEPPPSGEEDTPNQEGSCCEDDSGCGDSAANMLYFFGFPLGYSKEDSLEYAAIPEGVTVVLLPRRTIAGLEARCYEVKPPESGESSAVVSELCFAANGAALYWRNEVLDEFHHAQGQAVAVDAVAEGAFDLPYAVVTPAPEPDYVYQTPEPPIEMTVRVRFPGVPTGAEIDTALGVLRRRIQLGPGCTTRGLYKPIEECIATRFDGSDVILTFGVSRTSEKMTNEEIAEWLAARGDGRVRVRFCEALQDSSGDVATAELGTGESITYRPGTCEAVRSESAQVQVTATDGSKSWISPRYRAMPDAPLDDVIWTPAVADLRGQPTALTDAYLLPDAPWNNPNPVGWRVTYNTTDDGAIVLDAVTRRLGPKDNAAEYRADREGYPIVVFLDGAPVREADGGIAAFRIFDAEFSPSVILRLSRDDARNLAQIINAPALAIPIEIVSITRGE